jgi:hypothetical protein
VGSKAEILGTECFLFNNEKKEVSNLNVLTGQAIKRRGSSLHPNGDLHSRLLEDPDFSPSPTDKEDSSLFSSSPKEGGEAPPTKRASYTGGENVLFLLSAHIHLCCNSFYFISKPKQRIL